MFHAFFVIHSSASKRTEEYGGRSLSRCDRQNSVLIGSSASNIDELQRVQNTLPEWFQEGAYLIARLHYLLIYIGLLCIIGSNAS